MRAYCIDLDELVLYKHVLTKKIKMLHCFIAFDKLLKKSYVDKKQCCKPQ